MYSSLMIRSSRSGSQIRAAVARDLHTQTLKFGHAVKRVVRAGSLEDEDRKPADAKWKRVSRFEVEHLLARHSKRHRE